MSKPEANIVFNRVVIPIMDITHVMVGPERTEPRYQVCIDYGNTKPICRLFATRLEAYTEFINCQRRLNAQEREAVLMQK